MIGSPPNTIIDISKQPEKIDLRDLKRKSVRGGAMTLASQAVSTVVHLASTVILARMLTPADYGLIAMVTAITSFAGLFRDLGLSSAAIQKKDLTTGQQTNLFWLNVAMGAVLTLIVTSCSPLVAWFYEKPELTTVTIALSFNFLIGSFGAQHGAMLVRNMQFGRKAVASITAGVVSLIVAIAMAYNEYSYWALVASSLAGSLVGTTLLFLLSPFWPGLPGRGRGIKQMVKFGADITIFSVINYFHRNLDNILIGKIHGTELLGVYTRAYSLLMFPVYTILGPLNSVAFPALSSLQSESKSFRKYYKRLTELASITTMPICAFLAISSYEIVETLLGEKWIESARVFSILAIVAFVQPSASLRGTVVTALGMTRRYLLLGVLQATATSIGFSIGIAWGIEGVAWSYVISVYLVMPFMFRLAFRGTPVSAQDFVHSCWRPFTASLVAASTTAYLVPLWLSPNAVLASITVKLTLFLIAFITCLALFPGGIGHFKSVFLSPRKVAIV